MIIAERRTAANSQVTRRIVKTPTAIRSLRISGSLFRLPKNGECALIELEYRRLFRLKCWRAFDATHLENKRGDKKTTRDCHVDGGVNVEGDVLHHFVQP
jgi:hypothetical protein